MAFAQSSRVRTNSWFSLRDSNAAMIFVHGVFSDSQSCWLHVDKRDQSKNAYWPALVAADARFGPFSIFLPDYYSAIDSSSHSFIDCAHELFSRLRVPPEFGEPSVLEKKNITFICHSQGGLVVRQLLVRYHKHFESKRVGLFLIASPSRGSFYASFVERLGWLYGHQQIIDMGWDSESLRRLDEDFRELLDTKVIPRLYGREFYETRFVNLPRWMPPVLPLIVSRAAAATYFPKATAIPGSHFSVAKPPTRTATVNNYLLEFVTTHNLMSSADGQNDEEVSPVATPRSKYPTPHLQLTIEDPANSQMRISPTREMQPDVTREINRIAQKHEIPAFADVKEILSQLPSKSAWHEEWINYELPENASQEQRYAKTVYEWWFSTRAKLCERHRMETIAARGGPLTLTLRNTGTAHAKGLRIYVWIPNWADMSSLASAGSQYYQLPGGDKKHFAIEVDFYGRSAAIPSGRTTVNPNTATLYLERSEFTQTETAYRAFPGELSHGDKVQLSTLRVSVKLEPAKDISVRYRLHAENQPKDTEGAFILKVTEEAGKL